MKNFYFFFIILFCVSCGANYTGSNFRSKLITVAQSESLINTYINRTTALTPIPDNSSFLFGSDVLQDYAIYLDSFRSKYNIDTDDVQMEVGLGAKQNAGKLYQSLIIRPILEPTAQASIPNYTNQLLVLDLNDCCPR